MSDELLFEVRGAIATITLNRPDKLNAFTIAMIDRFIEVLDACSADDTVRVIVVTGTGRAFSSGGDNARFAEAEAPSAASIKAGVEGNVQRLPRKLAEIDKPVIAAINGIAVGAGLDIALMCDVRFAAESARLGEVYARIGLIPGAGGAYYLPRLVGTARALEMLWGCENIDASTAERIGLVNHVVPDAELMARTYEFAERVANTSPLAVRLIKRLTYRSMESDLQTALELVASNMPIVRGSADHLEAVSALRDKRVPSFEGR